MAWYEFIWDGENESHLAEHGGGLSMSSRSAKHTRRELTAEERQRVSAARSLLAGEEVEIRRRASAYKHAYEESRATLQEAVKLLKSERERSGLSLADISDRTGIERPNLSRLENEPNANPTVATLLRYADALGKRLIIVLADQSAVK